MALSTLLWLVHLHPLSVTDQRFTALLDPRFCVAVHLE